MAEKALFAAGCFWGVQDSFDELDGVIKTSVGYTGGHTKNPTYREVCTDSTGHAEAVLVEYDPTKVSYGKLLKVFWSIHDPTTKNRQGPDAGTQYRSAVFYFSEMQKEVAEESKEEEQKRHRNPITTEINKATQFYPAEDYHQHYHKKNPAIGCLSKVLKKL